MGRALSLGLMACRAEGDLPDPALPEGTPPPAITSITFKCNLDGGTWRVEVGTDAWAGGASLMWTLDGSYVELQPGFRSVQAAADGTSDLWRLDLTIVDDFRPAGTGGNTAFTCNDETSALVWVEALDQTPVDCRQIGPAARVLLPGKVSPPCPTVWEPPPPEP
ncbi:MAG TPA: hypothetical protein PKA64_15310 [Myxococcota bacterium]|nr:hypothetical protein [Myxococcota bacterium]